MSMNNLDVAGILSTYALKVQKARDTKHLRDIVRDPKSELDVVGSDVYPVIKIINEEVDLCDSCRSVIADCMNYLVMIKRKMTNKCTKGAPV